MATLVKCECGCTFEVESNLFTRDLGNDIEETGFTCPLCGVETVAVRTDLEIRKLQDKYKREFNRANKKVRGGVPANKAGRKSRQIKKALNQKLGFLNNHTPPV